MGLAKHGKAGRRSGTIKEYQFFCLSFLVPALISLIGYIIIVVWPFGDGTVLIIDSLHQYLPFYTELNEKLRSGQSLLYDFSAGFGYNFWATIAYYMASPLNLLIALVPKQFSADFMDYLILVKIGLCGAILSWYLYRRDSRAFDALTIGTMYALGNFIIGYYFNLMWLDSIAMLPLIMYGIEKIVAGQGGRMYGLALFYAVWCNYYIGFMLCIFSVLYYFTVQSERTGFDFASFLVQSFRFGWYSLLAGGMASVLLLPAYRSLAVSESMQGNHFPTSAKFYMDFVDLMISHFAVQNPINISDTQAGLNAYCGSAVLIFVILFVLDSRIALRKKVGRILLCALLLLSFSLNFLNYIWHGFHLQNGLPNRFAFIYVVLLLVMTYDVLPHVRRMELWKVLLAGVAVTAFAAVVVAAGRTDAETYGRWNILSPVLLGVYLILLLIIRQWFVPRRAAVWILSAVMLVEAAAHGLYGFYYNENVTRSIYLKDQASYKKLVGAREESGEFFRAEYDSQRMRNVAMYSGANSTIMFNSTMYSSVTDFCDHIGMEARTNKNGYIGVTSLMNDVFGIRYVLSSMGKGDRLYHMEKVADDGNLVLYQNPDALSIGFLVQPDIRFWDIGEGNPMDVQNRFVELATGQKGIFVLDRTVEAEDSVPVDVRVPDGKQVYIYLESRAESIRMETPEYSKTYKTYTDHLYPMNSMGDGKQGSFTLTLKKGKKNQLVKIYTCADEAQERVTDALASCQLTQAKVRGNALEGSIDAQWDGILLLTVPYDAGWTVLVDGEKTGFSRIGKTFIGIELPKGQHTVAMRFIPDGFYPGLFLGLVSLLLYLLSFWLEMRSERNRIRQVRETPSGADRDVEEDEEDADEDLLSRKGEGPAGTGARERMSAGDDEDPLIEELIRFFEDSEQKDKEDD